MSNVEGPGKLTGPVDTGFDDAIAGNVWADPAMPPAHEEIKPAILIKPYPGDGKHTCVGAGARCDICFGPMPVTAAVSDGAIYAAVSKADTPPEELDELDAAVETALAAVKIDDATIQATKALVHLPPGLDYPALARLARDMAMDIKERHVILRDHNLTQVQYDFLEAHNEFFKNALSAASIEWHAPLSTAERIKVEAAAILEDSLPGLGARMQNKSEGLPGVIEAAKLFAKVAGVGEREGSSAGTGERFTINIDLGGDAKVTVSTGGDAAADPARDSARAIREDAQIASGLPPLRSGP